VAKLLAQAYTEQRTMDMRWPGADYAPIRITRGSEESRLDEPAPLLEAERIISRDQQKTETDVQWMQAKAEAELLEHQTDAAIATLTKALERHETYPAQLNLLLAIAYLQKGDSSGDSADYAQSVK